MPSFSLQNASSGIFDGANFLRANKSAAYEVKSNELQLLILGQRLDYLIEEAIEEAEEFGDRTPEKAAIRVCKQIVYNFARVSPPDSIRLPNIGVMPDGGIELGYSASRYPGVRSVILISQDGSRAKEMKLGLTISDPCVVSDCSI